MSGGDHRDGLNLELLGNIQCPKPSLPEQKQIARFLDHETGKIDALIEKQQALIALLKEKRQAVISHAVTKGLNPNVTMKDSGVEWLGQVPEHWETPRSKLLFRERAERSDSGDEELLTVSHITGVTKRSEKDVNMIMAESLAGYKICHSGDLIINTMWAWMGAMGCSFESGIVSPSYNVYSVRDHQRINSKFVDILVRTPEFVSIATSNSRGIWSSRLRLYPESFGAIQLPVPPRREQDDILDYINLKTGVFEAVIMKSENMILLLQERRTALISAAVTGKIDVRDWEPAPEAQKN
jgi:type I restriction enzyme S subunit